MFFGSAEIMNLRNLERVLAREEEVKRRAIVHKTVYNGPQIHYISKNGSFFYLIKCGMTLPLDGAFLVHLVWLFSFYIKLSVNFF
jgi:hypothetical protein